MEFVEFLRVPNQTDSVKDCELQGRTSGDKSWRLARREIESSLVSQNYSFRFNADNSSLTYNCCSDEYNFNGTIIKKWNSCAYEYDNINRKVERDWKMSYLSRNEHSDCSKVGLIKWKLAFDNNKWLELRITINCKTFESGSIALNIRTNSHPNGIPLMPNIENVINRSQFADTDDEYTICAQLSGGNGDNGWQHSQLFRQSLNNDSNLNTFIIKVLF